MELNDKGPDKSEANQALLAEALRALQQVSATLEGAHRGLRPAPLSLADARRLLADAQTLLALIDSTAGAPPRRLVSRRP